METLILQVSETATNLWPLFLTLAVILFVAAYLRGRQQAGRDPLGMVLDGCAWVLGTAGIVFLVMNVIVGSTMPGVEKGIYKNCTKSRANSALCDVYNGKFSSSQKDPWTSNQTQASIVTQTPVVARTRTDIPVFVSVKFADGKSRDVCAVRADASGTYTVAVLCDKNDKVSKKTMSLAGADMAPLTGNLPTAPTPAQVPAAAVAAASPLLFEQSEAAAQCFWAELLRRKSELKTFGTQLLPSGSTWVLKSTNGTFFNSLANETYDLCTVTWGWCISVDGVAGQKLNGRSPDSFYGEGSFPSQCFPTTNP